jgi:dienelactone hydrolase
VPEHPDLAIEPGLSAQPRDRALRVADDLGIGNAALGAHASLFGNEDRAPTPEPIDQHEAELKKYGKDYEFHRYDGARHGFFYYDGFYRRATLVALAARRRDDGVSSRAVIF